MEKEFVPYTEALELKQLGFDEPCFGYWSNLGTQEPFLFTCELGTEKESCYIRRKNYLCKGPTYSKAFRWFRKKGYDVKVEKESAEVYFGFWWTGVAWSLIESGTYEEAELACLRTLSKIVKNK